MSDDFTDVFVGGITKTVVWKERFNLKLVTQYNFKTDDEELMKNVESKLPGFSITVDDDSKNTTSITTNRDSHFILDSKKRLSEIKSIQILNCKSEERCMGDIRKFLQALGELLRGKFREVPAKDVPRGSSDPITYEDIKEGDRMATFDEESKFGRYYLLTTISQMNGKNPFTNKPFGTAIEYYTAHLVDAAADDYTDVFVGGISNSVVWKESFTIKVVPTYNFKTDDEALMAKVKSKLSGFSVDVTNDNDEDAEEEDIDVTDITTTIVSDKDSKFIIQENSSPRSNVKRIQILTCKSEEVCVGDIRKFLEALGMVLRGGATPGGKRRKTRKARKSKRKTQKRS